jgi:LPXTG-motif cell wall-anchored protein
MNVPGGESYTITESNAELALHDWSAENTEQTVPFDTNSEGYATFTNNYELYLNLILHKARMNSNPTEYLDGAKFQLYEVVNGVKTPVGEEFEVTDGEAGLKLKLHDGSYILRETRAPNGYMLADDVAFEVSGGHVTVSSNNTFAFAQELEASGEEEAATSLTIYDVKIYELPSTGGSGVYGYIVGGTMMIVFSAFALTRSIRRKRGGAAE